MSLHCLFPSPALFLLFCLSCVYPFLLSPPLCPLSSLSTSNFVMCSLTRHFLFTHRSSLYSLSFMFSSPLLSSLSFPLPSFRSLFRLLSRTTVNYLSFRLIIPACTLVLLYPLSSWSSLTISLSPALSPHFPTFPVYVHFLFKSLTSRPLSSLHP